MDNLIIQITASEIQEWYDNKVTKALMDILAETANQLLERLATVTGEGITDAHRVFEINGQRKAVLGVLQSIEKQGIFYEKE